MESAFDDITVEQFRTLIERDDCPALTAVAKSFADTVHDLECAWGLPDLARQMGLSVESADTWFGQFARDNELRNSLAPYIVEVEQQLRLHADSASDWLRTVCSTLPSEIPFDLSGFSLGDLELGTGYPNFPALSLESPAEVEVSGFSSEIVERIAQRVAEIRTASKVEEEASKPRIGFRQ